MNWYQQYVIATGRAPALWAVVGFVVTFGITRGITRRIRSQREQPASEPRSGVGFGDIHIGGVHVHHQVWGIFAVLIAGLLEFRYRPDSPGVEILSAVFGAGAALILDEFALWFHLDDVYWGAEGRKSIDAILLGVGLGVVLLLQASPIDMSDLADGGIWVFLVVQVIDLSAAVICFLKSKFATGAVGIFVPSLAIVGACRLAKPGSVWARRRYLGRRARRMGRAQKRYGARYRRRHDRMRDLFGGAPDPSTRKDQPEQSGIGDEAPVG